MPAAVTDLCVQNKLALVIKLKEPVVSLASMKTFLKGFSKPFGYQLPYQETLFTKSFKILLIMIRRRVSLSSVIEFSD
jgi:hypothetical protein